MLQHRLFHAMLKLALLLYPFYVWWSITHWHPAVALVPLAALALLRAVSCNSLSQRGFFLLSTILLLAATLLGKAEQAMLYYPAWVNGGMLILFAYSLRYPPTVVERIATLMEGPLDKKAIAYTRNVTAVWCLFFIINGSIAAFTAWLADWNLWIWYNGFIAYLLMGLLMLFEWIVRRHVKATR